MFLFIGQFLDFFLLIVSLTGQLLFILHLEIVSHFLAGFIITLDVLQLHFEIVKECLDYIIMLVIQPLYVSFEPLTHRILGLLKIFELPLLVLELLLIEVLEFFLALIVVNLKFVHLLLVLVFLLSLFHLELFVVTVQLVELLRLLFLHHIVTLDEGEVLGSETRIDDVLLLFHLGTQGLLLFAPIFHTAFTDKHDSP